MSAAIEVVAVIGIVAYVIGRQLLGEPLRGKRVVLLPVVLTIIGLVDLGGAKLHVRSVDLACLVIGGAVAAGIGLAQGTALGLESRNGYLWGQMPAKGLWLWLLLVASRVVMTLVAHGLDAQVAASSSTILLMLGVSRLGQAAAVLPRAMSAGVPFAPEKDGASFLGGLTTRPEPVADVLAQPSPPAPARTADQDRPTGIDWPALGRQVAAHLENRRRDR